MNEIPFSLLFSSDNRLTAAMASSCVIVSCVSEGPLRLSCIIDASDNISPVTFTGIIGSMIVLQKQCARQAMVHIFHKDNPGQENFWDTWKMIGRYFTKLNREMELKLTLTLNLTLTLKLTLFSCFMLLLSTVP